MFVCLNAFSFASHPYSYSLGDARSSRFVVNGSVQRADFVLSHLPGPGGNGLMTATAAAC